MFRGITLRGTRGEINHGFRLAASLHGWVVARDGDTRRWTLTAYVERADSFQLSRRPLQFTAPRYSKPAGIWCFEVLSLNLRDSTLSAELGPPQEV